MKKVFDHDKYIKLQTKKILERVNDFNNKLYIEFGGKLFDDRHATRVLPGFNGNAKVEVLKELKEELEVLFVISAKDIEKNKIRSDLGIAYEMDILRQMDYLNDMGILANKIVITQYENEPTALIFKNRVERRNVKAYIHTYTKGYPTDVDIIVSDEGYGANPYIETEKPIVVVTAPGAGSGKLATCLSQIYHEYKKGNKAGYAKYETFPIWNLPLKHPINMAYEAATADLSDQNIIDSFHLEEYGEKTVNYNRDLSMFPVVKRILEEIMGESLYKSPTDMGINMAGFAIIDDEECKIAARKEIIRRYYKSRCNYKEGKSEFEEQKRIKLLMSELNIEVDERKVIKAALDKYQTTKSPSLAIELNDKTIITGRETDLMTPSASCIVNAIKYYAKIDDDIYLLSPVVLEPMIKQKKELFGLKNAKLNIQDVLLGLSILAATNPMVEIALKQLEKLKESDAHSSFILNNVDQKMLRTLRINFTSEPEFFLNHMYGEN